MNKIKKTLVIGALALAGCIPAKKQLDQNTLEDLLAPYSISKREFKKNYNPKVKTTCEKDEGYGLYELNYDDGTPAYLIIDTFYCKPIRETNKNYIEIIKMAYVAHGIFYSEKIGYFGNPVKERHPYSVYTKLDNNDSFFIFDIDRDGKMDFLLRGDAEIHPLPTNLEHKEVVIGN